MFEHFANTLTLAFFGLLYLTASAAPHIAAGDCRRHSPLPWACTLNLALLLLGAGWLLILVPGIFLPGKDWYGGYDLSPAMRTVLAIPILIAFVHLLVRYIRGFHHAKPIQRPHPQQTTNVARS